MHKPVIVFVFVMVCMSITGTHFVFADTIRFPSWPWFCPPQNPADPSVPKPSIDKDGDGKPDRKYVHINDSTGHDIQLWCLDHGPTGDFAYYSSAPDRRDIYIAGCLLICGRNFGDILVTPNSTIANAGNNTLGTWLFDVNGTITGYNHTNYVPRNIDSTDKGKDFHFHFNSTLGRYTLVATTIDPATGEHKIGRTGTGIFTFNASDAARVEFAMATFGDIERDPSSTITGEYAEHDENNFVTFSPINIRTEDRTVPFLIPHPAQVQIDQIQADIGNMKISFDLPAEHVGYFNVAIPRELLDHGDGEQFLVLVDERETEYAETTTDSYRTLDFNLPVDAHTVTVVGTKAIPEFGAIAAPVLVASVLALVVYGRLFRASRNQDSQHKF